MTATDVFYRNVAKRYPTAARGAGVYIFDDAGKRYLDGCSGALVANLGHGRRELFADLAPAELDFFHTSQFTNVAQERLARALAELTPPGLRHTYFVSGGSEANETALKIAYQYHRHRGNPGKTRIVSKNPSYHGNTLGALGASVHRGRRRPVEALLAKPISVEPQLCAGCRYLPSCDACATAWAAAFERAILAAGPETVGTFICETVTGSSCAAYAPPAAFFGAMRAICDRHDIVYIADEVMCGMGRTGTPFAIQQMGVAPDIITTAKGISAGYAPLGAAIVHDRIFKVFLEHGTFNHGFTNVGSPIATAIGSRVLATYRAGDLFAQAAARGQRLR
ncbi:MAG: aspartate aminotransferase family protein, partial [Vulcanimicrobiaceae bacterium]